MAYAAATSLKQTIQGLLCSSNISIDSSSREILDIAHNHLTSLQETLKKSDERLRSNGLRELEEKIRDAIHNLEDSLESQFLSDLEEEEEATISSLDLKEVSHEFNSFAEAAKKMKEDYNRHLDNPSCDENDDYASRQTIGCNVKMVGLSDVYNDLKYHVMRVIRPDDFGFFSFFGKPGTGRSLLARGVYDDIQGSFDCSAWVRIGSTYDLTQLLLNIISQINPDEFITSQGEEKLGEYVYTSLEGRRYMVALDDVRDTDVLIKLRRSLPEQNNGSVVLLTTGFIEVAEFDERFVPLKPPTIDEDFFWPYILTIFFEGGIAPPGFEEIGRKIARNCGGCVLVAARIILILRKLERETEIWSALAEAQHDRVYMMDDELSEANDVQKYLGDDDQVWSENMFDISILIEKTRDVLFPDRLFPKMGIMTIYGMAGVGKTTLIRNIFSDLSIMHRFDHCVWMNVGSNYKSEEILADTLAQFYPCIDKQNIKDDATLTMDLCTQLLHKKCLIVLDDLWSQAPVHILKNFLPSIKGELVVTTRLFKVGLFGACDRTMKLCFLNKDESWYLLRDRVFGDEIFPMQLEPVGRKIAESCEGLPLLILSVSDKLSELEKTLEMWSMVASGKVSVIKNAEIKVLDSLLPSYEALPQHLKACFLYMGGFPKKLDIPTSKLINLWFAEGFLEPNSSQTFEDFAARCFKELVDSTTVMAKKGSDLEHNKTCNLHSVFWHLSRREAINSKIFYILNCDDYSIKDSMKSQCRLCIPNSILLGIEDDAMSAFSTMRTLLCTGPLHRYPVPLCLKSRNLKVLEALAIRFYEFPIDIVALVQLRYLALTCDGNLPPSISKLWNLQYLRVRQYLSIKSPSNSSYLPNEIWNMKELKHLHVSGQKLPNLDCEETFLPNLCSLLGVSVHSCTTRVFKRMPNLKKLGIQVELAPDDNSDSLNYMDHIYHLSTLESLKCVVVNPDLGLEDVAPPIPSSTLPSSLKKLSLSGLGYPWEYMKDQFGR
ncbi:putative late blight resistance protein homolog R1B-23 isoform X2 [Salvia hispanica]|uniref:putative late blight resistance protein homolog R1B-23 isoform X2 n=1 Tax=Salvia hispanica TaxID=49212 RepID=UPI00200971BA|nr:putative late blight resistance protein homolog R1B-23 isoform X2 [Salvia hispanica]